MAGDVDLLVYEFLNIYIYIFKLTQKLQFLY